MLQQVRKERPAFNVCRPTCGKDGVGYSRMKVAVLWKYLMTGLPSNSVVAPFKASSFVPCEAWSTGGS